MWNMVAAPQAGCSDNFGRGVWSAKAHRIIFNAKKIVDPLTP
jgi:hypothetical protein